MTKKDNLTVQPAKKEKRETPRYVTMCRAVVENKYVVGFTTMLTVWALTGDDLKLIATDRPADGAFDVIVVLCILVFSSEIIVSCVGKEDYSMSFFFWLDILSTFTLILDLSAVSDQVTAAFAAISGLFGSDEGAEDGDASNLRSSKTARIGAKAGRVVRVLRLVRILKLYKAYYEARARKRREEQEEMLLMGKTPGSDDEWNDEELEEKDEEEPMNSESRVGKKLSEMTTRRVIFLILSSLLALPLLQMEQVSQFPASTTYGADTVLEALKTLDADDTAETRTAYQQSLLRLFYYHNWFAQDCGGSSCPADTLGHLFWVGVRGPEDSADVTEKAQLAALGTSAVEEYNSRFSSEDYLYNVQAMPSRARESLGGAWDIECSDLDSNSNARSFRGISLLKNTFDSNSETLNSVTYAVRCPADDLRMREYAEEVPNRQTSDEAAVWTLVFYSDLRPLVRAEAMNNIIITFLVCVLLCVASLQFSHDANTLILNPLEHMMKRVEAIRDNPLIAVKMADEEFKMEEIAKAREKRATPKEKMVKRFLEVGACLMCRRKAKEPMETVILEKTIIKLGSLLALGFGEAGANIIGQNMQGNGAGVNAMVPGVRVDCIIGLARVQNFSTATEVLQSKIMQFVNQISEIVHGVVNEYHGAPNRNSGEKFLIIWQFKESGEEMRSRLAECSVVAFVKITAALHRCPLLGSYRAHPGLQLRLGAQWRVDMSLGLHCGWAIEGAIGSEYKIDASYLSPNVSLASSVESAALYYGVPLVLAESVQRLCLPKISKKCRLIDHVVLAGSITPMELYSLDLDTLALCTDPAEPLKLNWTSRNRFRARQFIESEKAVKLSEDCELAKLLESDNDFKSMRRRYTIEFLQLYNMGFQNYAQGEWIVARRMLDCTKRMLGVEDGPSAALLRFMESLRYEPPKDWKGIRELLVDVSGIGGSRQSGCRLSGLGQAQHLKGGTPKTSGAVRLVPMRT